MAAFAAAPEGARVHVVPRMTPLAVPRKGDRERVRRPVAHVTYEIHVRPVEGKIGLCAVIEPPAGPTVRVVTLLARRSQPPEMDIVPVVAADAADLGVLESRRGVALLACRHRVKAQQRKPRQIVIEEDARPPFPFVVALLASGSFLAPVDIVRPVARVAASLQRLLVHRPRVAPLAPDVAVRTPKRKLRRSIVVEDRH